MNQLWINKKRNRECILFFNGWGMDENAIAHLDYGLFDLCMFNNFQSIEAFHEDMGDYQNIVLIAWSLGVWAAQQSLSKSGLKIQKSIAINGTVCPVDDQFGIPANVFLMTFEGWSESNRIRFNRRMMGGNKNINDYKRFLSNRTANDQKEELQSIYASCNDYCDKVISWDVALIGQNDLIFLPKNQKNWWEGKVKVIENDQPHFPFLSFRAWEELTML
jgi:biotin synthesis protein BioG